MRKLSEGELDRIHQRLKSLQIRYTEVYEEIFDHYCSSLENSPMNDSIEVFTKLNETFAWSIVKNMDRVLEKNVSKQVQEYQLDYLKFWNHGHKGVLVGLVAIAAFTVCMLLVSTSDLLIISLTLMGLTAGVIYFLKRDALSLSLNHKPVSIYSATLIKKVGMLNSFICSSWLLPIILSNKDILSEKIFALGISSITALSIIYSISLLATASNLTTKNLAS